MHKALSLTTKSSDWNPEIGFEPQDELSKTLLKSIPRKVSAWLERLNFPVLGTGQYGALFWNFQEDCGTILVDDESEDFMQIWWGGPLNNISLICGSDDRFTDLSDHIDFFVKIEQRFYNEMEKLEQDLDDRPTINSNEIREALAEARKIS